jgi:hypothetical protein
MFEQNPKNFKFHEVLEDDIVNLKGGLLTFTVRVNNGVVSDYVLIRYDKKLRVSQTSRDGDQRS